MQSSFEADRHTVETNTHLAQWMSYQSTTAFLSVSHSHIVIANAMPGNESQQQQQHNGNSKNQCKRFATHSTYQFELCSQYPYGWSGSYSAFCLIFLLFFVQFIYLLFIPYVFYVWRGRTCIWYIWYGIDVYSIDRIFALANHANALSLLELPTILSPVDEVLFMLQFSWYTCYVLWRERESHRQTLAYSSPQNPNMRIQHLFRLEWQLCMIEE